MTWQAAIQAHDRLIIALGTEAGYMFDPPDIDLGEDYLVVTIEDDAELDVYLRPTDPAWLSEAPFHVLDAPPS